MTGASPGSRNVSKNVLKASSNLMSLKLKELGNDIKDNLGQVQTSNFFMCSIQIFNSH